MSTPSTPSTPSFYLTDTNMDRSRVERALEQIQKSRKAWKNCKGNKDALVWPLYLERSLLEGLETYILSEGSLRSTKQPQRYPQRNRHVSDYIYETTGDTRTPKQIGSRIQQLRDTCNGPELVGILSPDQSSPKPYTGGRPRQRQTSARARQSAAARRQTSSESLRSGGSSSSEYTPSEYAPSMVAAGQIGSLVFKSATLSVVIDILPEIPTGVGFCGNASSPSVLSSALPPCSVHPGGAFHPSLEARSIRAIDPSVTFISQELIDAHASWAVYTIGSTAPVHTELTPLSLSHQADGGFHYSTNLVPTFWGALCNNSDPTCYTIEQDIVRSVNAGSIFSASYRFQYPAVPSSDSSDSASSSESEDFSGLFTFQPEFATDFVYDQLCTENVGRGTYEPTADHWLNGLPSDDQYLEYFTPYGVGIDGSPHHYDEYVSTSPTSSCFSSSLSDYLM